MDTKNVNLSALLKSVHFVVTGKGGVGKSLAAAFLMEYLQTLDLDPLGIDTDTENKSLVEFGAFRTEALELLKPGTSDMDLAAFDRVIEHAASETKPVVVDAGANTFRPLLAYMKAMDGIGMLKEVGRSVVLHVIVAGGKELADTAAGLAMLHSEMPEAKLVLWLNEHFGDTKIDGKMFEESELFEAVASSCIGIVLLRDWSAQPMFAESIRRATMLHKPLWGIKQHPGISLPERTRIARWAGDALDGLAGVQWAKLEA